MPYLINLNIGDFFKDGHGEETSISIYSSLSRDDLIAAYYNGVKLAGFDITEYCKEYEDNHIDDKVAKFCDKYNIKYEDDLQIYGNSFFDIYLQIALLGNANFNYEFADIDFIDIGGYGLFI